MGKKMCEICGEKPATVPDRERMGRLINRVCSSCRTWRLAGDMKRILELRDKNGVEIKVGDMLFNQYDREQFYKVIQDEHGGLFLGDLDSPLERYAPEIWWEVMEEEK